MFLKRTQICSLGQYLIKSDTEVLSTERSWSIMLSPSCLVWKFLNLGNYFSFFLLAFSLCSGNLESPFALSVIVNFIDFFVCLFLFLFDFVC